MTKAINNMIMSNDKISYSNTDQIDELMELFDMHNLVPKLSKQEHVYVTSLAMLISSLNWNGDIRHLFESLPYIKGREVDLLDILNTMSHLGYKSDNMELNLQDVDSRLMPCLFVPNNNLAPLVLLKKENGIITAFDSRRKQKVEFKPSNSFWGNVYFFSKINTEEMQEDIQVKSSAGLSWFSILFYRFHPIVKEIIFASFVINTLALAMPLFIMSIYDVVIGSGSTDTLKYLIIGVIIAVTGEAILRVIRLKSIVWLGCRLDNIVSNTIFERLLLMKASYTEGLSISAQISRIKAFESVRKFFVGPLFSVVIELPFTIILLLAIWLIAGSIVYIPIAVMLVFVVLLYIYQSRLRVSIHSAARAGAVKQQHGVETLMKMHVLHYNGMADNWWIKYKDKMSKASMASFKSNMLSSTIEQYNISQNENGTFTVEDTVGDRDGTDIVENAEFFQFGGNSFSTSEIIEHIEEQEPPEQGLIQLENGNYDISNVNHFCIELDSISSNAGYNNSFGHYFADSNGNPIAGKVDFVNVKDTLGEGEAVVIAYEAGNIPEGAVEIGFFLIPDGADKNPSLVDGAEITFQQGESNEWIPFFDGNELSGQGAPIFFSEQSLNVDGVDHMNHSGDGEITLGFEDLRGGGDNDFNDVIVNLNIREINADPEPFTLGGRDVPRNDYDVDNLWNQELAGHQVAVTPYSHLDNKVEGQFGFEYKGDVVRGIGVKGGDPEIHGNEGISIDFGGLELKSVTVGLRALFQEGAPPDNVETASWKAFKGGEEVASGEIDAVSGSNDGKVESTVEVENGFDELVFFTEESGSDYHIEYIEGEIPAKAVEDYNISQGIGGDNLAAGDDNWDEGEGDDNWIDDVDDDNNEGGDDQGEDDDIDDMGDDMIIAGRGDDILQGGGGSDIVVFQGPIEQYNISQNENGTFTVEDTVGDRDGTDIVENAEFFQFGGNSFSTSEIIEHIEEQEPPEQGLIQLENGNYDISNVNHFCIELDSISSNAGYNNSFGHYFADSNGNPIAGKVDFVNVKDTLGEGEAVVIAYEAGNIPEGAVEIGFFLIPDGADKNPSLVDGAEITFQQGESNEWIPFFDGNELSGQGAPIFFSEQSLNVDGVDHMNHSGDGEITLGFEDLRGGGDNDFNDVIVNLNIREINADPEPFTLGGRDVPRNDYDVDNLWNQELTGHQVAVTPYSHLDNKVEGQFGFEYKGDVVRGIGVKGGDPEIHGNEGISIDFGGLELKSVTVGLRALFQEGAPPDNVETASWKAFKGGEEVASGEIDAVSGSNDGKVESTVEVENGFDELVFFTEESGSDYHIEYIEGEIPAKAVEDYNISQGIGGDNLAAGDDNWDEGEGDDNWIDDVDDDNNEGGDDQGEDDDIDDMGDDGNGNNGQGNAFGHENGQGNPHGG